MSIANGLKLDPIPAPLRILNDIECRLISLRIPFMLIFCLHKYGSQYKLRGSCTNVPATLDQIMTQLPRMSSEVQFHPMKLKKRLIYKSSYMYHFIQKDVVMAAINWFLKNNPLYKDIQLNTDWVQDWLDSEFAEFLHSPPEQCMKNDCACECSLTEAGNCMSNDMHSLGNDVDNDTTSSPSIGHSNDFDNAQTANVMQPQLSGCSAIAVDDSDINSPDSSQENTEFVEDQQAELKRLNTVGEPLPNMLQFENPEQDVYSCAPGEDNIPQYILMDKKFELLAFPDLFPLGRGGYETAEQRPSKLTLWQYFQQRLQNMDGRFARNIEYLFCAQHATDLKQIQSDSNFALHLTRCKTLDGKKITAGMLKDTTMLGRLVKSE